VITQFEGLENTSTLFLGLTKIAAVRRGHCAGFENCPLTADSFAAMRRQADSITLSAPYKPHQAA
jgi:hypothetical protein